MSKNIRKPGVPDTFEKGANIPTQIKVPPMPCGKKPAGNTNTDSKKDTKK